VQRARISHLLDSFGHGLLVLVVLNQYLYHSIKRLPAMSGRDFVALLGKVGRRCGYEFHQILHTLHPGDSRSHYGDFGSSPVSLESNFHLLFPPALSASHHATLRFSWAQDKPALAFLKRACRHQVNVERTPRLLMREAHLVPNFIGHHQRPRRRVAFQESRILPPIHLTSN
jgi:hypothetical protein